MDDIIFWGFALLCSIVLPMDMGELWQGYMQFTNNISLEQRMPPLKCFLWDHSIGGLASRLSQHIHLFSPNDFSSQTNKVSWCFVDLFTMSIFRVVTIWICLDILIPTRNQWSMYFTIQAQKGQNQKCESYVSINIIWRPNFYSHLWRYLCKYIILLNRHRDLLTSAFSL